MTGAGLVLVCAWIVHTWDHTCASGCVLWLQLGEEMAFFNLTYMGPQEPIKGSVRPRMNLDIVHEQGESTSEEDKDPAPITSTATLSPVPAVVMSPKGKSPAPSSIIPSGLVPTTPRTPSPVQGPPEPKFRPPEKKRTFVIPDHPITAEGNLSHSMDFADWAFSQTS